MKSYLAISFILLQLFCLNQQKKQEKITPIWDYFQGGDDWQKNSSWQCNGINQSPIDIKLENLPAMGELKLKLINLAQEVQTELINTGNTLKSKYDWLSFIVMDDKFKAKSILFRAPSEHTINGKNSDLELQIILENVAEKQKYGILSLLFSASRDKQRNLLIEPFSAAAMNLIEKNSSAKIYVDFGNSLKQELSTMIDLNFVRYQGSLTVNFYFSFNIIIIVSTLLRGNRLICSIK